jgi:hypothetical protein
MTLVIGFSSLKPGHGFKVEPPSVVSALPMIGGQPRRESHATGQFKAQFRGLGHRKSKRPSFG